MASQHALGELEQRLRIVREIETIFLALRRLREEHASRLTSFQRACLEAAVREAADVYMSLGSGDAACREAAGWRAGGGPTVPWPGQRNGPVIQKGKKV